jgi:hypothetical protein
MIGVVIGKITVKLIRAVIFRIFTVYPIYDNVDNE